MGQCSTLPSEGRSSVVNSASHRGRSTAPAPPTGGVVDENTSSHRQYSYSKSSAGGTTRKGMSFLQVHTTSNTSQGTFSPSSNNKQQRDADVMSYGEGGDPMDTDDNVASRDDMMNGDNSGSIIVNLPPPPEIAVKTRCYKLNLDSDMFPAPSVFLGPFADMPPPLTYSASSSESEDATPLQVAIQTAQIFRGITIGNDGTILSQNARATRSSRGQTKNKRGEKSRQAAKIEQAKDLVEETILTGKAPESDEDAHMQSLYIMGEYDDMKYLVRDGSKKLRDAAEFPDDTLLTINRLRPNDTGMIMDAAFQSSPRKRGPSSSSSSSGLHRGGGSKTMQPPKLKSHPRDRPSSRTGKDDKLSRRHQLDGESEHGQHRGENWGNALPVNFSRGFHSIWNCGATGDDSTSGRATSPTQVVASPRHDGKSQSSHHSSHHHHHSGSSNVHSNGIAAHHYSSKPMYEGRDSQQYGQARESGVTTRAT